MFKDLKDGEKFIRQGCDIKGNHIGELINKVEMLTTGMINEYCKIINHTYPDSIAFADCWYEMYKNGIGEFYEDSINLVI